MKMNTGEERLCPSDVQRTHLMSKRLGGRAWNTLEVQVTRKLRGLLAFPAGRGRKGIASNKIRWGESAGGASIGKLT